MPDTPMPRESKRLDSLVAATVALLVTFMGVCKVKDDNIVQAMQQAQADKLDHWNFYQARNIREDVARAALVQLQLTAAGLPAKEAERYAPAIQSYQAQVESQAKKKADLQAQAEADQRTYDALNIHDDQFDLSDALLAIALAMFAITALTDSIWLYLFALVPSSLGVVMGLAGLLGWSLHPDAVTKLLS